MSILNDLFEQIIQSEERIRERFSKLREVNNEIQDYQVKYQDFTDELKSLQGLLVLKNQRLAEEKLNLKWFKIREDVLTQKKTELSARKENLFQQKENVEEVIDSDKTEFTKGVVEFMTLYDFCERGKEKRVTEATKQMEELSRKENKMKQDMARVKQTQEQMMSLLNEKNDLSLNNSQKECKLTALTTQLQNATDRTQFLQAEKQKVALKPHNDPEFKRLADELEAMKDNSMEGICEALTDELKELQQIYMKSQLHKQKQQQQQQILSQDKDKGRIWRKQLTRKLMSQNSGVE